jgi:hypothetical protein
MTQKIINEIEEKVKKSNRYNIKQLQRKSIESSKNDGLFLEFGVYYGESIKYLSSLTNNTFYGFDSFEGLPENWGNWMRKGAFKIGKKPPNIESDKIKIVEGLFGDTLDDFVKEHTQNISFIHIDCDLYSSTKTIFDKMKTRFVSGTVILFDELINYPDYLDHEIKAFAEFLEDNTFEIECLGNSFNDNNKERAAFILL